MVHRHAAADIASFHDNGGFIQRILQIRADRLQVLQ